MCPLAQTPDEWLKQADYDLETAAFMLSGGRNIYAVFMAHLAVEKALKAVYCRKFSEIPPKTHSLMYLLSKNGLQPPVSIGEFIVELDHASVATRYPEELSTMSALYTSALTEEIFVKTKEALKWVKMMF
jgi:HEPN domain-containing protein